MANFRLLALGSLLKITRCVQIFAYFFPRLKLCINVGRNGWASFWPISSQTHPVTLDAGQYCLQAAWVSTRSVGGTRELLLRPGPRSLLL
jgi:hypothetical protein